MPLGGAFVAALLALCGLASAARAESPSRECAGIRCASNRWVVSRTHRDAIAASLRWITGLRGLQFDADGTLFGDDSEVAGGSPSARDVLAEARRSGMEFVIEDHSNSASVTFAQLDAGTVVSYGTGESLVRWAVRLDFADFRHAEADDDVRRSFDIGFAVLHEALHGLGYEDARGGEGLGSVEERLNAARAELGLPQRERYFGEARPLAIGLLAVRLPFSAPPPGERGPGRRRYLTFVMSRDRARAAAVAREEGIVSHQHR